MLRKLSKAGFEVQVLICLAAAAFVAFTPGGTLGIMQISGQESWPAILPLSLLPENMDTLQYINAGLLLVTAFMVNLMLVKRDLIPHTSFFGALTFILLSWFAPGGIYLFHGLLVTLILLLPLNSLMNMYMQPHPHSKVMTAAISIGVSAFFIPETLIFFLFVWLGFFTLRVTSWREWVISILGLLVPFFYFAIYLFFTDKLWLIVDDYTAYIQDYTFLFRPLSTLNVITIALLLLFWLMVFSRILMGAGDKLIAIRKRIWLIIQFQWAGIACVLILSFKAPMLLPLLYVSLAMMVAFVLHQLKTKMIIFEIVFGLFLIFSVLGRLFI
ncbi:MAG: hypothetical protein PHX54_02240 [Lentimicrobiaceae bacterium]|nr:hypothetical protein [Lentimicrobiaceae bacterium]